VRFESTIPTREGPQSQTLDLTANGMGVYCDTSKNYSILFHTNEGYLQTVAGECTDYY
jgi:hypothetical protein